MKILVGALAVLLFCAAASRNDTPILVGEGVISTPDDEAGIAVSADGNTVFFGKSTPATLGGDPMRILCTTHRGNGGHWAPPEIAAFSGVHHDLGPSLTPDGSRLYFTSDRPLECDRAQTAACELPAVSPEKRRYKIWFVERNAQGWGHPRVLGPPVSSDALEYGATVARDGTLYFASNRKGGAGSFDIYRSRLEGGEYKTVESVGASINTAGPEIQPAISPDGTILVFLAPGRDDETIGIHKEYAHGDLYVSFFQDGAWTAARNCGPPINSAAAESWPAFSSDGTRFFFSSERGFATLRPAHPLTWKEMQQGLMSVQNGMGNIYEISSRVLKQRPLR